MSRTAVQMKAELRHNDIVIGSLIEDLIGDIEWGIRHVAISDPYFAQLSVEKFTLEHLLQEISKHDDIGAIEIVEMFAEEMNQAGNMRTGNIFFVARDAAVSILDRLYFGI